MFKKRLNSVLGTLLIFSSLLIFGCGEEKPLRDGKWSGVGEGKNGPVTISLEISGGRAVSGEVISDAETDFAKPAIPQIIGEFVEGQDLSKIDAVSGATLTSQAAKDAISDALRASRGTQDRKVFRNTKCDVVVIGAGGAGLSAATAAASRNMDVIVLEKMGIAGGNSNFSTGGLNASQTIIQKKLGIEDSNEQYFRDTMVGGKNLNDEALVRNMVEHSAETVDWLMSLGADLTDVGKMAGSTNSRTHRPQGGGAIGAHLVPILHKAALDAGAEIRFRNRVVDILEEGGKPAGVRVRASRNGEEYEYEIRAKSIVVATGGFGANPKMLVKFRPELEGFGTTNHPGATGDAFSWVEKFGADLVQMDQIQTHPTVVVGSGLMITEAVRGNGAIMVNRSGERFINEMLTRDVTSAAVLNQEGKTAFLVFDQGIYDSLKAIRDYDRRGLLKKGGTLRELAENAGLDAEKFENSVEKYNAFQKSGVDSEFGRNKSEMPRAIETGPFYAVEIEPAVHHTMGGIKIDTNAQVLDKKGKPIPGLFAAGEVTGGIHGANRLGGNAVADVTIYGRIAGENAAAFAK